MYYIPALGVVGLVVMVFKAMWVSKQDAGDAPNGKCWACSP